MKKLVFFFTFFIFFIHSIFAQSDTDYNIKGDQALQRLDFLDARMWYSIGIEKCDKYSIHKLTLLWNKEESMRESMHVLMAKCANCLESQSLSGDTDAMLKLSEFYEKGIGVEIDTLKASYFEKKALGYILGDQNGGKSYTIVDTIKIINKPAEKEPFYQNFQYFISYSPSWWMPVGIKIGILNDRKLGFYCNYKMNLDFIESDMESKNGTITDLNKNTHYAVWNSAKKEWNRYMLTAGIICPIIKNTYASIGIGYGKHDIYWKVPIGDFETETEISHWCHDTGQSYKGISMELGGMYKYKHLIFSSGISTISYKDIDAYIGLGYVF